MLVHCTQFSKFFTDLIDSFLLFPPVLQNAFHFWIFEWSPTNPIPRRAQRLNKDSPVAEQRPKKNRAPKRVDWGERCATFSHHGMYPLLLTKTLWKGLMWWGWLGMWISLNQKKCWGYNAKMARVWDLSTSGCQTYWKWENSGIINIFEIDFLSSKSRTQLSSAFKGTCID